MIDVNPKDTDPDLPILVAAKSEYSKFKLWVMLTRVPQFVRLEQTLDKYTLAIVEIDRGSRI